jgi:hypothetical protein
VKGPARLSNLLEAFFLERLMQQRWVSPHTIASYRDTFRLADHAQSPRPPNWLSLGRLHCPLQCELGGNEACAGAVGKLNELLQ